MWTARAGRFQKPEETKEAYRIVSYLGKTDQTWGEDEKFFDTVSTLWDDTLEKIKEKFSMESTSILALISLTLWLSGHLSDQRISMF